MTRRETDGFLRLMVTNDEMDDVRTEPLTEKLAEAQAASFDQEAPTKADIETWVDECLTRNSDKFMDLIFNSLESTLSEDLKMAIASLDYERPTGKYMYKILH